MSALSTDYGPIQPRLGTLTRLTDPVPHTFEGGRVRDVVFVACECGAISMCFASTWIGGARRPQRCRVCALKQQKTRHGDKRGFSQGPRDTYITAPIDRSGGRRR